MNEEMSLITFKAICNFANDLSEEFGSKHTPLKLYKHLLNKTQISHTKAMFKHIELFREFCTKNREAILSQDHKKFTQNKIVYSDRVFMNLYTVLEMAKSDSKEIIWQHILTISALVDPASKAKELLKKNNKNSMNEVDFISNMMSTVEKNVKPDSNPMEAVNSIIQSGAFTELLSGMQGGMESGQLDMGKLLAAVQSMVTNIREDPESKQASEMLGTMVNNVQDNNTNPMQMMQMMTSMLSSLNNPDLDKNR